MSDPKKLFLVDGSNQAFRSFFAIQSDMRAPNGFPTRALFGFTNALLKMMREHAPDYVLVAFDRGLSFRNDLYPEYKGQRPDMPADLRKQWPEFIPLCEDLGIPATAIEGFEADDIIGTLADRYASPDLHVSIVSTDKDFAQLVSEHVDLVDMGKGTVAGPAEIEAKWGVKPDQIIELLTLMGDKSDNVPGVPGIGAKTAAKLLATYPTALDILKAAEDKKIKGKRGERIIEHGQAGFELGKALVTIHTDMELPFDLDGITRREPDWDALAARFRRYNFRRLRLFAEEQSGAPPPPPKVDTSIYRTVTSADDLAALAKALRKAGRFAFDTETTSLNAHDAQIVGMSFCWSSTDAVYVPIAHDPGPNCEGALDVLLPILADPKVKKTGQNLKYDLAVLRTLGHTLAGIDGDIMLRDYLIDVDRKHGLDDLARRYLEHSNMSFDALTRSVGGQFAKVPVDQATRYAAEDAHVAFLLENEMRLPEHVARVYTDIELPLVTVLEDMERHGIRADANALAVLGTELAERIDAAQAAIYAEAGKEFNVNSTKQLAVILFEERGLKPIKKTKTGYSTAAAVLEQLAVQGDALCQLILDYRSLAKLKSTYVDALPEHIAADGRIHTSFHQAVAATGRLSSNDPNLQNIPIRTPDGRRIRKCFVPADGYRFLSCDYSQIELRVLAHFCGDGPLVDAFLAGQDIHRRTASEVFEVPLDDVTPDQRRAAKAINFGIVYGMSAFRLSNELNIGRRVAQNYIDGYFARYPQVKAYMDGAIDTARETGKARTLFGRERRVRGLDSRSFTDRGAAERIAINTPVQGTAADLIKMAMIRVHKALAKQHPSARLLLQVHDELVLEVPRNELLSVSALVRREMESVAQLAVPLRVDIGMGDTWDDAH